jgi:predicted CoA-binding protein
MENKAVTVAVLGASDNPERYSHRAVLLLKEKGYTVIPVHPSVQKIEGIPVTPAIKLIKESIDTVSVYLGPQTVAVYIKDIIALKPKRVIMNPGAESDELEKALKANNITCQRACTLVLLKTGQF